MSPADQEKLFTEIGTVHPTWTPKFKSGYVHGANDETTRTRPVSRYVREATGYVDYEYALGYLAGFATHRGVDAEMEPWFDFIGDLVRQ
jgi:hypothetical protein